MLSIFRGIVDQPESGIPAGIDGFSGALLFALLQSLAIRIVNGDDVYVDIGIYRSITLSSVASATSGPRVGIEDVSLGGFNRPRDNRHRVEAVLEDCRLAHVELLDMDAEITLASLGERFPGQRIGLLFVDGDHDHCSQLITLLLARQHVADGAVIVIDGMHSQRVRPATEDFLQRFPEFALAAKASTASNPANMDEGGERSVRRGWWNGTQVLVHDSENTLSREQLPLSSQHHFRLFHDVFRNLLADRAHGALKAVVAFVDEPSDTDRLALDELVAQDGSRLGRFEHQNTDSADQPETWTARLSGSSG